MAIRTSSKEKLLNAKLSKLYRKMADQVEVRKIKVYGECVDIDLPKKTWDKLEAKCKSLGVPFPDGLSSLIESYPPILYKPEEDLVKTKKGWVPLTDVPIKKIRQMNHHD